MDLKKSVCTHCSVGCTVIAEVSDGVWIGQTFAEVRRNHGFLISVEPKPRPEPILEISPALAEGFYGRTGLEDVDPGHFARCTSLLGT